MRLRTSAARWVAMLLLSACVGGLSFFGTAWAGDQGAKARQQERLQKTVASLFERAREQRAVLEAWHNRLRMKHASRKSGKQARTGKAGPCRVDGRIVVCSSAQ